MTAGKKRILQVLIAFFVVALLVTWIAFQLDDFFTPQVETINTTEASLVRSVNTVGRVVYEDEISYVFPFSTKINQVAVKNGEVVAEDQAVVQLDVDALKLRKEELSNQLKDLTDNTQTAHSLEQAKRELEIAEMSLALFDANRQIKSAMEDREHKAKLKEDIERSEESLLSYKVAKESFLDNESAYLSDELRLKLAVLQAQHEVLLTDFEDVDEEDKNAAQLRYEMAIDEYQQKCLTAEMEDELDRKKLELSALQCQDHVSELGKGSANHTYQMKNVKETISQIDRLIGSDGWIKSSKAGQIVGVDAQEGGECAAQQILLRQSINSGNVSVYWEIDNNTFKIGDEIKVSIPDDESGEEYGLPITHKKFVSSKSIEYGADLTEVLSKAPAENGSEVDVSGVKYSERYKNVIPISAISFLSEKTGVIYCAADNGKGKLVSKKMEVTVLAYDDMNVAIEDNIMDPVISFSNRALIDGGSIRKYEG